MSAYSHIPFWANIESQQRQAFDAEENQKKQRLDTSLAAADASAVSEAGDYEAAANRETAAATNSLAQRLASARRTPGGGIRLGMKRKGFNASLAGGGLNRANSAGRLERRKNQLRTAAQAAFAQDDRNKPGIWQEPQYSESFTLGPIVGQQFY